MAPLSIEEAASIIISSSPSSSSTTTTPDVQKLHRRPPLIPTQKNLEYSHHHESDQYFSHSQQQQHHQRRRRYSNGSSTSSTSSLYSLFSIPEEKKQLRWADEACDTVDEVAGGWEGLICCSSSEDSNKQLVSSVMPTLSRNDFTRQELSNSFYTPTELLQMERNCRSVARRNGNENNERGLEALTARGSLRLRHLRMKALHAVLKEQYDCRRLLLVMAATTSNNNDVVEAVYHHQQQQEHYIMLAYQYACSGCAEAAVDRAARDAEIAMQIVAMEEEETNLFEYFQGFFNTLQRKQSQCQKTCCWSLPLFKPTENVLQTLEEEEEASC